jgi:tripartite ATP-independent transporter DctM subunit
MWVAAIQFLIFFILMALGFPVAFCLMGAGLITAFYLGGAKALYVVFTSLWGQLNTDVYIAIPLFVLMAAFLQYSGIANDIYDTLYAWLYRLKGSLAVCTIISCAIIAAITGLGGTGTILMGFIAYPQMLKYGYNESLAMGCIPPAGALGPIIPPSILMIILGGLTGVSVGKLFTGGFGVGILITILMCLYVIIACYLKPSLAPSVKLDEEITMRQKIVMLYKLAFPLILILAVLGSIYAGVATPTEGAAVGAVGTLIITIGRRKLGWRELKDALELSLKISCMVLWLLVGGALFSSVLIGMGASEWVKTSVLAWGLSNTQIIWTVIGINFILGMLMDSVAVIMICLPLFMPLLLAIDVDMVWFLVFFTVFLCIGYVTPPYGMNLFYFKGIVKDVPIEKIYKSVIPFVLIMALGGVLSGIFPPVITWLVSFMK